MPRLELHQVTRTFVARGAVAVRAVDDLSFTLNDGEFLVIAGPSGSGKTTALRLIAGLEKLDHGSITWDGAPIHSLPPLRRDVGMVFQSPALFPHLNVDDNIALGLKLRKYPRAEINTRVRDAAELLRLNHCLERLPQTLSGGEKQRVAIARVWVRRPRLFLFDEPLSNLEPAIRAELRSEISSLHRRLGSTTLYVTHDREEALILGDRLAIMRAGRLQQIGAAQELYRRPANRFVANFVGRLGMNFFPGRFQESGGEMRFESNDRALSVSLPPATRLSLDPFGQDSVVMGIRPEHLEIVEPPAAKVIANVVAVQRLGDETRFELTIGENMFMVRTDGSPGATPQNDVPMGWNWDNVHWFHAESGMSLRRDSSK